MWSPWARIVESGIMIVQVPFGSMPNIQKIFMRKNENELDPVGYPFKTIFLKKEIAEILIEKNNSIFDCGKIENCFISGETYIVLELNDFKDPIKFEILSKLNELDQ
jgi:hypothetical protein